MSSQNTKCTNKPIFFRIQIVGFQGQYQREITSGTMSTLDLSWRNLETRFSDVDNLLTFPVLATVYSAIIRVFTKPVQFFQRKLSFEIDIALIST